MDANGHDIFALSKNKRDLIRAFEDDQAGTSSNHVSTESRAQNQPHSHFPDSTIASSDGAYRRGARGSDQRRPNPQRRSARTGEVGTGACAGRDSTLHVEGKGEIRRRGAVRGTVLRPLLSPTDDRDVRRRRFVRILAEMPVPAGALSNSGLSLLFCGIARFK